MIIPLLGILFNMDALMTALPNLTLVTPDVTRDATPSVAWLNGEAGYETMVLMGNAPDSIGPTTLKVERERIAGFLSATDQLTWTIEYEKQPVGAVWVNLAASEYLPAPSIHIMLGDPAARGHGLGSATLTAIIKHLRGTGEYEAVYSRYLLENQGSKALLNKLGFQSLEEPYQQTDGLSFQNVILVL